MNCDEKEFFEERAAIAEHCGGLERQEAERLAMERLKAWRKAKERPEQMALVLKH